MSENAKHVICARSYKDLETAFVDCVRKLKAGDSLAPVVVVVRGALAGAYLNMLLAVRLGGHANVRLVTLERLASELAADALRRAHVESLPEYAVEALAGQLAGLTSERSYFRDVAAYPGFRYVLAETFRDLREGAGLREAAALRRRGSRRLSALADLFQSYLERLAGTFVDGAGLTDTAAEAGADVRLRRIAGCTELIFYGFYDFNAAQKRLVEALSRSMSVVAFVPYAESADYVYARPTMRWFEELGFRIEQAASKGEPACDDIPVRIISCATDAQEAEEIARTILALVENEDLRFQDFGVVTRDWRTYAVLLSEVFERAGIPYFLAGGSALASSSWARGLTALAALVASDGCRAEVMEFLTAAPIRFGELVECEVIPSEWDAISREAGISRGWRTWGERLESYADSLRANDEAHRAEQAAALGDMVAHLARDLGSVPPAATWGQFSRQFKTLALKYLGEAAGCDECLDVVGRLGVLADGFGTVGWDEFRDTLVRALADANVIHGRFGQGAVTIVDAMSGRGMTFDTVFIPGVAAGGFPRDAVRGPILSDADRKILGMSTTFDRVHEERMLFRLAVTSARRRALVSFPRAESTSGRPRRPSSFVLELAQAVSPRRVRADELASVPGFSMVPARRCGHIPSAEALDEVEFDLIQATAARREGDTRRMGYLVVGSPLFRQALHAAHCRWGTKGFTAYEGAFAEDTALARLREALRLDEELGVTSLEDYAACPFRYFVGRLLGIKEVKLPEDQSEMPPLVIGQVVHNIMAHFFRRLRSDGLLPVSREHLVTYHTMLRGIEAELFAGEIKKNPLGLPLLWRIAQDRIRRTLRAYLEAAPEAGDMVPEKFEVAFGSLQADGESERGSAEPVSLEIAPQRILRFRGRIDRIDTSTDGGAFRVIDYKTGKSRSGRTRNSTEEAGRQLQLVVYTEAASRILGVNISDRCIAEYLHLVPGSVDVKHDPISGENWDEIRAAFKQFVGLLVASLESGAFIPAPVDEYACRNCPYRRACGSSLSRRQRTKQARGPARGFLDARDGAEGDEEAAD